MRGTKTFVVVWLGQLVSFLGSYMGAFALKVWILQETGSVTQFALLYLFHLLPSLLISPLAGALIDRFDRRWIMVVSDTVSALGTLAVMGLLFTGDLQVWHVYLLMVVSSLANAFQAPAYAAAMTLLVPKRHLGRANGMLSAAHSVGGILSPALAGILMATFGIEWVLVVDLLTYSFALGTLLVVRFPRPKPGAESIGASDKLWHQATQGWTYIRQRPGLLTLVLFFAVTNFFLGIAEVLVTPLVLAFASEDVLGAVLAVGGIGTLAGSLVMSTWGGPRRRIHGVFACVVLSGIGCQLLGLRPSFVLVSAGIFLFFFAEPIFNGCSQAIWQSKVPPDFQGRVFTIRILIARALAPLSYLIAGPLADKVFDPLLVTGGPLTESLGEIFGVGPGRGTGFLFVILGTCTLVSAAFGLRLSRLRRLEDELPDQIGDEPEVA